MADLPESQRHAKHVGNPDPDCAVCVAKAKARYERTHGGVPVPSADVQSVRAVGGFVQSSGRFVR